jgi:multicomponent Na+:H+ antiporter subunit A
VAAVLVTTGSVLTVAYTARWWWGLFADHVPFERDPTAGTANLHLHRPGTWFVAPAAVFSVAGLVLGLSSSWFGDQLARLAASLDPKAAEKHLPLWAGFNTAVLLSAIALGGGALLFRHGSRLERLVPRRLPSADLAYQRTYDGLLAYARRLTAVVQNGSLPVYGAVVFITLVALLATALVSGVSPGDREMVWADSPAQVGLAVLIGMLAIGTTLARRRFAAALLLGGAGTFLALIFLFWGAPDLALTQVLVETLALVVLLLVLRHLPDRFGRERHAGRQWIRVGIAVGTAVTITAFAWIAATSRTATGPAAEFAERSLPEGGGKNVVNVILVDFRATDTLGEIAVLALAAAGVANLVRAARRAQRLGTDPTEPALADKGTS